MRKTQEKSMISILADNQTNVLARITSLMGRKNFNIATLTASETHRPGISLITIVVNTSDSATLEQILAQIKKLEIVRDVHVMDPNSGLYRELLLLKVQADAKQRTSLKEIADIFRAKIIDLSKTSIIIELTGAPEKIDGFLELMEGYELLEVCRTGVTGMNRGVTTNVSE